MAFDVATVVIGAITATGGLLAGIFAPKFKRDETRMTIGVQLAQIEVASQEKYYALLAAKIEKSEAKIEGLVEKVSGQGEEIASLRAEIKILQYSESALKTENASLKNDLTRMANARDALDFEGEQQAQMIASLNGRIQELIQKLTENEQRLAVAQAQLATYQPAPTPPTGGP